MLCVLAKIFLFMPLCIIRILPNPDRNLGSVSVQIKPEHLYCHHLSTWTLLEVSSWPVCFLMLSDSSSGIVCNLQQITWGFRYLKKISCLFVDSFCVVLHWQYYEEAHLFSVWTLTFCIKLPKWGFLKYFWSTLIYSRSLPRNCRANLPIGKYSQIVTSFTIIVIASRWKICTYFFQYLVL